MSTPPWRIAFWLALPCLLAGSAAAQEQKSSSTISSTLIGWEKEAISRVKDLFDLDVPETETPKQVKFSFQPHFRDLISKGYLRVPFELRWGVNDHFELNTDIDTYFDHGLRKGSYGYGLSGLHFGAKYAWLEWLKPTWDTSVGFNSSIAVSRPPLDLTDGHDHFSPYIVFGRKLDGLKGLSGFLNFHPDFVSSTSLPARYTFGQNEPHSDSFTVTPGLLYDHLDWHYTLQVDATTTRYIGSGSKDFLTIRPGVIWDLPKALVLNARGRWLAGFSLAFVFGPDGNTISTGGRLRGEVNLSRWFGHSESADSTSTGPRFAF